MDPFLLLAVFSQNNYFPLKKGNELDLYSGGTGKSLFIFDSIINNGFVWYLAIDGRIDTVRIDENGDVFWSRFENESIIFKTRDKTGESWTFFPMTKVPLISDTEKVSSYIGNFENCLKFSLSNQGYIILAPGIGPINWNDHELYKTVLNKKIF